MESENLVELLKKGLEDKSCGAVKPADKVFRELEENLRKISSGLRFK